MSNAEIVCSRCGTPFPNERGKPAVTCVVCGQLRPDLDMTLDEDDEDLASAMSTGAAGSSLKASAATQESEAPPRPTHVVMTPDVEAPRPASFPMEQNYVSMTESLPQPTAKSSRDSLNDRLGPVLLIVVPIAAGMVGALGMLSRVQDFSKGSWYAVATVALAMLIGSVLAGFVVSSLLFAIRLRINVVLRFAFLAAAVGASYYMLKEVPSHLQVRPDDLPGIVIRP